MRSVPLTAHPLTVYPFSILLSYFSFLRSHRASYCPSETGGRAKRRGWMVIVFVIVYVFLYLTQTAQNTQNYLSLSRQFTLALESADFVAGFATTAMRGVPLTAHPLHVHRLSFLLSPFSFLRSHRASRRDVVCDKFCGFIIFRSLSFVFL